ncbi:unnamed protein product [Allacma fusca]|nr:unnamed protein product [Allacma fusca]
MSNTSRSDHVFRGGGGGGGNYNYRGRGRGGRGGYRPRRYWDNDDYYKRDRDDDRRRRRRSRSRSYSRSHSRSRSRSYSGSRSRSRERSPRNSDEYQPKSVSTSAPQPSQQYEPYTPQKTGSVGSVEVNPQPPQPVYAPQTQQHSNGQSHPIDPNLLERREYGFHPVGFTKQPELPSAETDYYRTKVSGYNPPEEYGGQSLYTPGVSYVPQPVTPQAPPPGVAGDSKKKKEKKKKKRRQRSSSSSSSSSSSESSDSDSKGRGKRKSRRDSDSSDSSSEEDRKASKAKRPGSAVTSEQRKALLLQRENYTEKYKLLENNITRLMAKELDLRQHNADPSLVEENKKLQTELKGRSKAVQIVLEKINDILQEGGKGQVSTENARPPPVPPPPPKISQPSQPPPHASPVTQQQIPQVVNVQKPTGMRIIQQFDFYDNGLHWCRLCNVFPETIQDMLDHFHTKEHHDQVEQLGIEDKPWRKRNSNKDSKNLPGAKKMPFRGMQFFSPVEGWYCRICNTYMGDHEGAIEHLKNDDHMGNYLNFLDEHPEWEAKWSSDREKARGRSGFMKPVQEPQGVSRVRVDSQPQQLSRGLQDTTEVDENAKSIRIQMRNLVKADENRSSTFSFVAKPESTSKVDAAVDEWMDKPQKVKIDIDTQKFAAIVRQKHGQKEKEQNSSVKGNESSIKASPVAPSPVATRERDREREDRDRDRSRDRDSGRRYDGRRYGVEMSFNSRDRERDRYGNRGRRR